MDDGKSTLIGRLLYDSKSIFQDQMEALSLASRRRNGPNGDVDLSLLTDGLRSEREQGITIDVAYRYFATPPRTFIVADTPGHALYTRNMVTGASTADLAIILIDARLGVVEQSRRHAFLAALLGVPHLVLAVNKMDLVDWDEATFDPHRGRLHHVRREAGGGRPDRDPDLGPARRQRRQPLRQHAPGTRAPPLLYHLEHVHIASDRNLIDPRLPVQWVIRPGTPTSTTTTGPTPESWPGAYGSQVTR